jgi:hypothetical protein
VCLCTCLGVCGERKDLVVPPSLPLFITDAHIQSPPPTPHSKTNQPTNNQHPSNHPRQQGAPPPQRGSPPGVEPQAGPALAVVHHSGLSRGGVVGRGAPAAVAGALRCVCLYRPSPSSFLPPNRPPLLTDPTTPHPCLSPSSSSPHLHIAHVQGGARGAGEPPDGQQPAPLRVPGQPRAARRHRHEGTVMVMVI